MGFVFFGKNRMIVVGALLLCILMAVFPGVAAEGSKKAIKLWLDSIVPSLLPFLITANFLKSTGITDRVPPHFYPAAMAALSGYPVGAAIAGDLYRDGRIGGDELRFILSCSMITGPAFITGTVGTGFFRSYAAGAVLAVSHYSSALLNGLLYSSPELKREARKGPPTHKGAKAGGKGLSVSTTDSILDAFRVLAVILAYITFFMVVTSLLGSAGLFGLFRREEAAALAKGVLEMASGCAALAACGCGLAEKTVAASFLTAFGGLSVMGQTMSVLKGTGVGFFEVFKMKLSQGAIAAVLAFFLCAVIM